MWTAGSHEVVIHTTDGHEPTSPNITTEVIDDEETATSKPDYGSSHEPGSSNTSGDSRSESPTAWSLNTSIMGATNCFALASGHVLVLNVGNPRYYQLRVHTAQGFEELVKSGKLNIPHDEATNSTHSIANPIMSDAKAIYDEFRRVVQSNSGGLTLVRLKHEGKVQGLLFLDADYVAKTPADELYSMMGDFVIGGRTPKH